MLGGAAGGSRKHCFTKAVFRWTPCPTDSRAGDAYVCSQLLGSRELTQVRGGAGSWLLEGLAHRCWRYAYFGNLKWKMGIDEIGHGNQLCLRTFKFHQTLRPLQRTPEPIWYALYPLRPIDCLLNWVVHREPSGVQTSVFLLSRQTFWSIKKNVVHRNPIFGGISGIFYHLWFVQKYVTHSCKIPISQKGFCRPQQSTPAVNYLKNCAFIWLKVFRIFRLIY